MLKEIREKRNISRSELSRITGISVRSIQDYEQGHKDIKEAKHSVIRKFALALGCKDEEIIDDNFEDIRINENIFKTEDYGIYGEVKAENDLLVIYSIYDGKEICINTGLKKKDDIFKWQILAMEMELEEYISNYEFKKICDKRLNNKNH